jgi:ligand-binding sensor domain-containing protein/signal transduction histidine kinase
MAAEPTMRLFTTEDGLARNWVTRIRRDSQGRLWFCTMEGLSLFDGQQFANYGTQHGLPHRIVNDILEAGDGTYWLATQAGLYRFRPRTALPPSFDPVPLSGGAAAPKATVLFKSAGGEVWLGTETGLYRIETGGRPHGMAVRLEIPSQPDGGFPLIYSMAESRDGALWVATAQGLIRRRPDGALSFWDGNAGMPAPTRALMMDRDGVLWAGGNGGFCTVDSRPEPPSIVSHRYRTPKTLNNVHSLYQDSNGGIWFGGFGLAYLRPGAGRTEERFRFFDHASRLGSQYVFALAGDSGGHVWAALGNQGVARIVGPGSSQFTEADGLESRTVISVFENRDGKLYAVSGVYHTLNEFDGERFTPIRPQVPASLGYFGWGEDAVCLQDQRGEWWIATGKGLLRYPRVAKAGDLAQTPPKALYRQGDGLPDDAITRVFEDSLGSIWIGTATGLSRWSRASETIQDLTPAVQRILGHGLLSPRSFAEEASGQIWIGFYPGGLVRFRGGRFESITGGLPAGSINGLLVDHKGRLWVGSSQGGIGRIDEPAAPVPGLRRYTDVEGLRSRDVEALAEDHNGRIYIAGGQGVDRLDPDTNLIDRYPSTGGLPPGEAERLHTDRQGSIWFASNFGLSRLVPEAGSAGATPLPTIREIRVSGVPILRSDEGEAHVGHLRFPAGKDSIEIAYGSVDFSIVNSIRYRYRLMPVEEQWRPPTAIHSAQYAGIGAGSYRFEIQTVSPSGSVSARTAMVEFDIQAPFWRAWWFFVLLGAFLAALVFSAHLYRVRHLLALEHVRAHLAADLHDDLGSGLAEIAILTEVAKQHGNAAELAVVAQRARELRSTMGDIVWSVDPEYDNLDGLIRRWRQTAFALLGNESLAFEAPASELTARIELNPERRRHLLLLFKEVVTNVARHAQGGSVRIKVWLSPAGLNLEVRDNGCGFRTETAHSGSGLKNIVKRAEALGASIRIQSQPGFGTAVSLTAPFEPG